ncbi:MAG: fibro-slime domain-containing protein [Phycisphaeraceae bacterium]|nr:fibro-slime domain-containing protein [Phycisphaeraceae bacterium]
MARGTHGRNAAVSAAGIIAVAGLTVVSLPGTGRALSSDPYADLPAAITLAGTVRDFRAAGTPGGHADFEAYNTGHRVGLVAAELDADGKPVYIGEGKSVQTQYRDSRGRNIMPAMYDQSKGDAAGALASPSSRAVTSQATMAQWWRDVPGTNMAKSHSIVLSRQPNTNIYSFHEQDNESTAEREGFFPADNDLYNDMNPTYHHNYHFTYELSTRFVYKQGGGQTFTFVGDDDVYVFIDGKLAIDVGGVHSAVSQTVDLDRFASKHGLRDGSTYSLKFFFAERRTTRSNCRIDTTLFLLPAELPKTAFLFD